MLILCQGFKDSDFVEQLLENSEDQESFSLKNHRSRRRGGSIAETAMLVAGITGASTALSVLIKSMIKLLQSKAEFQPSTIVIQGKSRRLEIPGDTPITQVEKYVVLAQRLDMERMVISRGKKK